MTSTPDQKLRAYFDKAIELSPDEQTEFVRQIQNEDQSLARELHALLQSSTDDAAEESFFSNAIDHIAASIQSDSQPQPGQQFGPYRLQRIIGRGGMGVVFLAQQQEPKRQVAVKLLGGIATIERTRRFEREAAILSQLEHPTIARIYAAGTIDDHPYLAMEFVDGKTVTKFVADANSTTTQKLHLIHKICSGIQFAHQRGILHRDIKPDNILVDTHGDPHILDFGIARTIDAKQETLTRNVESSRLIGTIAYMSPEQCRADETPLDARSDVYALGVLTFELLTGRVPHTHANDSIATLVQRIATQAAPKLADVMPVVDQDLDLVVSKALAHDTQERYQSISEFAADIRRYLNHEPISVRGANPLYVLRRAIRRHRALAAVITAATIIIIASLTVATLQTIDRMQAEANEQLLETILDATLTDDKSQLVAAVQIDELLNNIEVSPSLEHRLHDTIARVFLDNRRPVLAEKHLRLAIQKAPDESDFNDYFYLADRCADAIDAQERLEDSNAFLRSVLNDVPAFDKPVNQYGKDECKLALRRLRLQTHLAVNMRKLNDPTQSERMLRDICNQYRNVFDRYETHVESDVPSQNQPELLVIRRELGEALLDLGRIDEAVEILTDATTRINQLDAAHVNEDTRITFQDALQRSLNARSAQ